MVDPVVTVAPVICFESSGLKGHPCCMYTGQRPGQTHTNTMPGLVTRSIPLHQIVRSRMPLDMHVAMAMRARVLCCTMNTVSGAGSCRDTGGPSAHVTPEPKTPSKKKRLVLFGRFSDQNRES